MEKASEVNTMETLELSDEARLKLALDWLDRAAGSNHIGAATPANMQIIRNELRQTYEIVETLTERLRRAVEEKREVTERVAYLESVISGHNAKMRKLRELVANFEQPVLPLEVERKEA